MTFSVIDNMTGKEADTEKIALYEEWAKHLIYCDMEGFAIEEDGALVLLDECGGVAYCPDGRFTIVFDEEQNNRKQSEWISVDERLPEECACYLVNIINHFGLDFVTFTYYTKGYGWGVPDVTHWMPLPEPPKMKGGEW